jgi:hypothetical protein
LIWIIQHAPSWLLVPVIYGSLLLGILGFIAATFLKFVAVINIYRRPLQIACVALLTLGVWAKGAYEIESEWRARVAELESQVAKAEERAKKINTRIVTKVVTKIKHHTEYRDRIKREIQVQKEYIDKDCKLNPKAVELYNQAVTGDK